MERTEAELIAAVLKGDSASFEPLVLKYSPRVFATARRYARRESEVEDIAQEVWLKAFDKLKGFRGEAPFEHWLMRMTVPPCPEVGWMEVKGPGASLQSGWVTAQS